MERFESEYGTLTALALFFGRKNMPQVLTLRKATDHDVL